jgi:phage shock protein A
MKDELSQGVEPSQNPCIADAAKQGGELSFERVLGAAGIVLAAEVRRLQTVVADQALTIGTLKDEIARLRAKLTEARDEHHDVMVRLRLEPPKGEPYNGY